MRTRYGFTASALVLISVLVVFILSSSGRFSFYVPSRSEFAMIPIGDHLQTKLSGAASGSNYAVLSEQPSATPNKSMMISVDRRFRNRTVIKQDRGVEHGLARARAAIRKAASSRNLSSIIHDGDVLTAGDIYHNPGAFYKSYTEMEKRFKVYVYEEGDPPMVHDGPCKNIYTTEGRFIHEMEKGKSRFRTRDARRAHVYFLPFSVSWMVKYLYEPLSYNLTPLRDFVSDYVRVISTKHPFWNRTQGADHFMLSCHDWGPHASRGSSLLYNTSIRVLCNANSSEGFNPQKDVSLPEIHLYSGDIPPQLLSPPSSTSPRPYLAFFAGGLHGPFRPILLRHWQGRDPDLPVHEYLPKDLDYYSFMLQSRYCLCPSGYEVASPRIVEAIYTECVPVILSDHYVLPFSDVLRWEAFSIRLEISEIPRLKEVLTAVPERQYARLKKGLRAVRRHFVLNQPAQRFDVFHMILHSVWLRRINLMLG
ncbi:probable glycosyltransferase At5g25310 isoform X2 [Diospyros lotus]|uniref:probable glycosyltransferase At5g25310 isoform X2 n=1 Tax=Diospyros lotus TaxID=55363 RepID=UPI0022572F71|nr:probable glycosyltransferase At5g25310 isoform X2 [Diospyros lotus]